METIFSKAVACMDAGESFAYATIVRSAGSTPRSSGSKMLVLPDRIIGTIGGGGSEYSVIKMARDDALVNERSTMRTFDMSPKSNDALGLVCGGDCDVLIAYVSADDADAREVLSAAHDATMNGKEATLYSIYDARDEQAARCTLALFVEGEGLVGDFPGIGVISRELLESPIRVGIHCDDVPGVSVFSDAISAAGVIYLFGAGHVSKEVAYLAVHLGYKVTVFDDRAEYANEESFPGCEIVVLDDFLHIPELVIDDRSHILIITRGHAFDRDVLEWAIDKPAHYIGMIGSKTKRAAVYNCLRERGATDDQLALVHSPIGLEIGAKTPAEIAVSIMAEIISCK